MTKQLFFVHIKLGDRFRDEYIEARTVKEAIAIAKRRATPQEQRWAAFVA
jgi:hypothetical protein